MTILPNSRCGRQWLVCFKASGPVFLSFRKWRSRRITGVAKYGWKDSELTWANGAKSTSFWRRWLSTFESSMLNNSTDRSTPWFRKSDWLSKFDVKTNASRFPRKRIHFSGIVLPNSPLSGPLSGPLKQLNMFLRLPKRHYAFVSWTVQFVGVCCFR